MNETELDELLDTWTAPPPPASLRESVQVGYAADRERKKSPGVLHWITAFMPSARKSLVAAAILAVGALFLVVTLAIPQTHRLISPPVRIPYIVDSEVVRYRDDGTSSVEVSLGSYNNNGRETILYEISPSFLTGIRLALNEVGLVVGRLTLPFVVSPELLKKAESTAFVSAGFEQYRCGNAAALLGAGCVDGPVISHETILGHPTVAVQPNFSDSQRVTLWMAPDLGCFALRITREEKRPDGTFRLVIRKQAIKVTLNPSSYARHR